MTDAFLSRLANPPKTYRPIPFWSWNERLSVEETRRQIAEMDRVGIGGYFMHARGGLQTPYMGEEWLANIAAGIEEGRTRDMGAWAYDENGWPSGFGDGRVNGRGEGFQQKYLRYEVADAENSRDDGRTIGHVQLDDGRLLHFFYDVNPFYVDTLDAEVTRTFLEEIYAPYCDRFTTDFGSAMPGFFTDEPQVSRNGIPWSLTLPSKYRESYGEDLLAVLPHLFLPIAGHERTRYRFWKLVLELFVTNFTQQIYEWCENHGVRLTGHMVLEETFLSQITSNAAVMPHYEFFHIPGMDWLGRHIDPPTTPLQVASVAHQVGRPHVLSETFALTGWNVSFEELKWMFEWQMVRGVTLLCQHLEGYSLRGIRKRDYPPSLFYQQPWWDHYRAFNDAMTRVGMLLADGKADFDVLVLHPQASAWLHFDAADNAGIRQLFAPFMELTKGMEAAHVPFDYGDERILARHATVAGSELRVGKEQYSVVVVPPCDVLALQTATLLANFADAGGTLIWVGRPPTMIDGEPNARLDHLVGRGTHVDTPAEGIEALPCEVRTISVADADGTEIGPIACTRRLMPAQVTGVESRFYFFANADAQCGYDATVTVPGQQAIRVVTEDGSLQSIATATSEEGRVAVQHHFEPGGSLSLLVTDKANALDGVATARQSGPTNPLPTDLFAGDWEIELADPNALTLDTCSFWFDGELQAENEHISVIQGRALRLERPIELAMEFMVRVA